MSLHYPFPTIHTINDVLPHLDANFRVVEKDGMIFINYLMMGNEVFPPVYDEDGVYSLRAAVRRECRGIVFDSATRLLISRPFHKFFNAGEREDVSLDKIDVTREHQLLEKLDGSMIRPLHVSGGFRWGTKMGITDVGMIAEEFVAGRVSVGDKSYIKLAEYCHKYEKTALFELCSRRSRIVVDYPEETLVLLAIRDNASGEYMARWEVRAVAGTFRVPVVDNVDIRARLLSDDDSFIEAVNDLDEVMSTIRADVDGEGKILVWADGHAVKIKSDKYVRVHRAKDMMRSEMRLLDLFFNEELDDLLATIDVSDQNRIEAYLASFKNEMNYYEERIKFFYDYVRATYVTKKEFALSDHADSFGPMMKGIVFSLWDEKYTDAADAADKTLRGSMSSETKFASLKSTMEINTGWTDIWASDAKDY